MKPLIIGVAGKANAGKDTTGSMILYHFLKGNTGSYADWLTNRVKFENEQRIRVKHFADDLKEVVSNMFNITVAQCNDRKYKDERYYCIENGRFYEESEINRPDFVNITEEKLQFEHIADIRNRNINAHHVIKLRTLIQYIGTDICRNFIDYSIWTRNTLLKARKVARMYDICVIADVRFENEAAAIQHDSLYGGLIKINRDNVISSNHKSEQIDFDCEYVIDNNGTLMNLFYKTMELTQVIKDKYKDATWN